MTMCSPDVMMRREPAGVAGWGAHYGLLQEALRDNRLEVRSAPQNLVDPAALGSERFLTKLVRTQREGVSR